ncbi:MAG TPA: tRNA (cytidine(34)-2'-O)-methyltransferase [Clostridiaceae bacterium]|nr:tRNA (cytidine(34)-2'-O)-methyltransferase [Clostridiaceae bacterium]
MNQLSIALVEPEIPPNTGNIARTCVAVGCPLHICGKPAFDISDKEVKRAGLDYWYDLDLTLWDHFSDLLQNRRQAHFYYATTKGEQTYADIDYVGDVILVFGKETKGLPDELLLAHPERCVRIPMLPDTRSLNLANSVAIMTYEVLRQWGFPNLEQNNGFMEQLRKR